ncbi:metallophosphoesterase family protein [Psychrobacillus vulpis]|uniref:Metallophosphoesterase family protein n=1 Tax=Psychrobacillus vulpis TaxID=2325572 RepID=A0A544TSE8_9BACI|nr:metallophosphoesterase family protein [Psychrobacillus vulpis]TQR20381.1 metallophosphoesterase family protein [Psychrobacillus vulpis]
MKYAIITDVHGNELALKAVLQEIDDLGDIEEIWCLGDMIAMGPDTNEVLDLLFSRQDVQMITGNHDEAILSLIDGEGHPDDYKHTREHHVWVAKQLSTENINKLKELPRVIEKTINGTRMVGIHYHMEEEKRNVHIKDKPFFTILDPTLENMEKMFGNYPAHIIFFGHHHPEHFFQNERQIYLNPGSLGVSKGDTAPYGIIDFSNAKPIISLHHVTYDKASFLKRFETFNVPQREIMFKLFYIGE